MSQDSYSNPPAIEVMSFREGIRRRPGMYFGNDSHGSRRLSLLEHALTVALEPPVDVSTRVNIRRSMHGEITIEWQGPPLALETPYGGQLLADLIHTSHARWAKPPADAPLWYRAVDALSLLTQSSRTLTIQEAHGVSSLSLTFVNGSSVGGVRHEHESLACSVRMTFEPDPILFTEVLFDLNSARAMLDRYAVCHPGLAITYFDESSEEGCQLYYPQGTRSLVQAWLAEGSPSKPLTARKTKLAPPLMFSVQGHDGEQRVDVTCVWSSKHRQFIELSSASPYVNESREPLLIPIYIAAMTSAAERLGVALPRRRATMAQLFRRSVSLGALVIVGPESDQVYASAHRPNDGESAIRNVISAPLIAFLLAHPELVRRFAGK